VKINKTFGFKKSNMKMTDEQAEYNMPLGLVVVKAKGQHEKNLGR
jgi:hypothetical protein